MEILRINREQRKEDNTPTLWLQEDACESSCMDEAWNGGCYHNQLFYEGVYNVYYQANQEEKDPQE